MTSVDPAVESPSELSRHAVSVPVADGAHEHLAAAGLIFVVGIIKTINVGNAVSDGPVAERKNADWNVEIPSEGGYLVRPAIVSVDLQDADDIAARMILSSEWVLHRFRHPEPAAVVKIDVDRLADIRLGGDQLHFKRGGHVKTLAF